MMYLNQVRTQVKQTYSETSQQRTPLVLEKGVRYREVSAIERFELQGFDHNWRLLVPERCVRYREVSAIKHVRYREVPLYTMLTTSHIGVVDKYEGIAVPSGHFMEEPRCMHHLMNSNLLLMTSIPQCDVHLTPEWTGTHAVRVASGRYFKMIQISSTTYMSISKMIQTVTVWTFRY